MGVVCNIARATAKIKSRGMTCMLLGYTQNHTGSTYGMLNIRTKLIVLSHDEIFLKNIYGG